MKMRLIAFAIALAFLPDVAYAQAPAITPCTVASASATVCFRGPGVFFGFVNNSITAQTATMICYDNVSAASGTVIASTAALAASATSQASPGGKVFVNGLTCLASGATTGAGIDVYVYSNQARQNQ